jgi:hypothetical protein
MASSADSQAVAMSRTLPKKKKIARKEAWLKWESTCLASVRLRAQTAVPPKKI